MSPRLRKLMLAVHLTCSVGWMGAAAAYLTLVVVVLANQDARTVRDAILVMVLIDWFVIVPLAVAAQQATHAIGMPEALYPLTEATLYLALAPKSNSGLRAYTAAQQAVQETGSLPVPLHLRNAATGLMRNLGYGKGYQYAHDFPDAVVGPAHLPEELKGRTFYTPGERGWERREKGPSSKP